MVSLCVRIVLTLTHTHKSREREVGEAGLRSCLCRLKYKQITLSKMHKINKKEKNSSQHGNKRIKGYHYTLEKSLIQYLGATQNVTGSVVTDCKCVPQTL